MGEVDTEVPNALLARAAAQSHSGLPVVFVRFYPQLKRWITFHARPPLNVGASAAGGNSVAQVKDAATGRSFPATTEAAAILQPIFARRSGGVSFRTDELSGLERTATVVRVMHLVHPGTAGLSPLTGGAPPAGAHKPQAAHAGTHKPQAPAHPAASPKPVPQQLTYSTIPTPAGETYWTIRWHLSRPSERGGWIVQHIVADEKMTLSTKHLDYWEAWQVPKRSASTKYLNTYPYDDMFRGTPGTHATGSARFYEGLRLPPSFVPNNAATAAWILPATTKDPKLPTTNATAPVNRDWTSR